MLHLPSNPTPACNIPISNLNSLTTCSRSMIPSVCVGLGNFVLPQSLLDQEVILEDGKVEKLLREGDIIEIDRTIYSHWAVYVGNGFAVHIASVDPDVDVPGDEAMIVRQPLVDIAGESLIRINNKVVPAKTRGLTRRPENDIVQSALKKVGRKVDHNLITQNMEHFVTECAYGKGWSDQAELAQRAMSILSEKVTSPDEAHQVLLEGLTTVLSSSPSQDSSNSSPQRSPPGSTAGV